MRFLTQNLLWKLFALIAAFGVWLNVASEPELATIVSVPVEYNNFPKDLEISSNIVESIDVEARGPAGQLRTLSDSHIAAIVDFASVKEPGERTFTLTASELKLPRGIDLIRTIPAQLRFKFERRATRAVPVTVAFSGKLPAGFSVAQTEIEPPELTIAGPESHVVDSKNLVSDPFDLTGVTDDTERKLAVYAAEPEVRILNAPQVTVKIRVRHGR
ncbi:MAG: CdaR family protein [Bryobacteraceae bacterium]|jgi:YbbR domain-containing protein